MPNLTYGFLGGGGPCAAGPGAPLPGLPNPIALTWPQLLNAQLRLGVYPPLWVVDELTWRTYSFCIACAQVGIGGVPAVPGAPPGALPPGAPVAGGAANLPPSPVAVGVDATERGQLGYHMGTAVGGSLAEYLVLNVGAPGGTLWFPFHLSRALLNGGVFGFFGLQRPDIVLFGVDPAAIFVWNFVVWENKGHCANFGGLAAIAPALVQAQALVNMTSIPGNPALGVIGGAPIAPWAPDCHIASQVDLVGGNFRVQTIDPSAPPPRGVQLTPRGGGNFLRGYYAPFLEAVQRGQARSVRTYGGRRFQTIELPKQIRFGLDDDICRALQTSTDLSTDLAKILAPGYAQISSDIVHIHATGISTEIPRGWSPGPESN